MKNWMNLVVFVMILGIFSVISVETVNAGTDYLQTARESLLRGDAGKGDAIDNFRYYLKEHPADISVRWELINVYMSWNWYNEIHKELVEINEISKNSLFKNSGKKIAETYQKIAKQAFGKNDTEKGAIFTKLAGEYFPKDIIDSKNEFLTKAKKALEAGKKEQALKCFNTAKALDPQCKLQIRDAYYKLAYNLVKEEKYNSSFYYFNMGDSFYHKKDAESMAVGNTLLAKAKHLEMTDLVNNEPLIHNFYKIASVLTENVPAYEVSYELVDTKFGGRVKPQEISQWYIFPSDSSTISVNRSSKNGKLQAYVDTGNKIEIVKFYEGEGIEKITGDIKRIKFQSIDEIKTSAYWLRYNKI